MLAQTQTFAVLYRQLRVESDEIVSKIQSSSPTEIASLYIALQECSDRMQETLVQWDAEIEKLNPTPVFIHTPPQNVPNGIRVIDGYYCDSLGGRSTVCPSVVLP